ncbi:Uncharacterised protein [Mycobacterium tuberculosis]|nr:Uncharacterised protein [Mycobacterium tuberculosis]
MNRTARSLLGATALAPFAAALAVAAAPANASLSAAQVSAARADAVPGPSTALLYDTAAAAYPVTEAIPAPLVRTAGRTAESATGPVDRTLGAAPGTSGLHAASARCKLNPGKTLKPGTGAGLPETLPAVGGTPLVGLPKGDCLGKRGSALRTAALPAGLPSVASALGFAQAGDLPVSTMLFPQRERRTTPAPSGDVVGQANDTVNKAGASLDRTEQGVGQVVEVLKARDRVTGRRGAGPLPDGPLSMPDASVLGLRKLPGIG